MEHDGASNEGHANRPMLPAALMLESIRLWQAPMIAGTAWWNIMVQACWPHVADCRRSTPGDEHGQLIVPGPIEADGERNLLA